MRQLGSFHEAARKTLDFVSGEAVSDEERTSVWLRLCLNEGCLHAMLHKLLCERPHSLGWLHEEAAFIRSERWVQVLLSLLAGLDQVDFRLASSHTSPVVTSPLAAPAPPPMFLPASPLFRAALPGEAPRKSAAATMAATVAGGSWAWAFGGGEERAPDPPPVPSLPLPRPASPSSPPPSRQQPADEAVATATPPVSATPTSSLSEPVPHPSQLPNPFDVPSSEYRSLRVVVVPTPSDQLDSAPVAASSTEVSAAAATASCGVPNAPTCVGEGSDAPEPAGARDSGQAGPMQSLVPHERLEGTLPIAALPQAPSLHAGLVALRVCLQGAELVRSRQSYMVFKLHVESPVLGELPLLYRRYSQFVTLLNKLRAVSTQSASVLPLTAEQESHVEEWRLKLRAQKRHAGALAFASAVVRARCVLLQQLLDELLTQPPHVFQEEARPTPARLSSPQRPNSAGRRFPERQPCPELPPPHPPPSLPPPPARVPLQVCLFLGLPARNTAALHASKPPGHVGGVETSNFSAHSPDERSESAQSVPSTQASSALPPRVNTETSAGTMAAAIFHEPHRPSGSTSVGPAISDSAASDAAVRNTSSGGAGGFECSASSNGGDIDTARAADLAAQLFDMVGGMGMD